MNNSILTKITARKITSNKSIITLLGISFQDQNYQTQNVDSYLHVVL